MTTNWEEKLNGLRDRIKVINDDNSMELDYEKMNENLDKIKLFIDDSKNAHKLTVEEQEEIQGKIKTSFEDLEKAIIVLENKIKNLKLEHTKLKNKIATITVSCVTGGLLAGVTLTWAWSALKSFIVKHKGSTT